MSNSGLLQKQLFKIVMVLIFITTAIFVVLRPVDIKGLEIIFFLPANFSIASLLFGEVFYYMKKSIGLTVLYGLLFLRYIVCPILISLSGTTVPYLNVSSEAFRWAILMMILELYTVMLSIKLIWSKKIHEVRVREGKPFKLTWSGLVASVILIVILLYRGHLDNVLSHLSVWTNAAISNSDLHTYDFIIFILLRTFFSIAVIAWAGRKASATTGNVSRTMYTIIALMAAISNIIFYDYKARAALVETVIATVAVLMMALKKRGKKLYIFMAIIALVVLIGDNFIGGTVGIDIKSADFSSDIAIEKLSINTELYTNNVSTLGFAYDQQNNIRQRITFLTLFSDIVNSIQINSLPGFRVIPKLFSDIPTTFSMFMSALSGEGYILGNAGWSFYYGGYLFGWMIDILIHVVFIKAMYHFYRMRKSHVNVGYIYIFIFCEIICSLTLMNNIFIMMNTLTGFPLYLYVLMKLNDLGNKIKLKK